MILGFNTRFEEPILKGTKIHTIRVDAHRRWHAGRFIQMAVNVRTAWYRCFKEDVCRSVQQLFMTCEDKELFIAIDGKPFYEHETLAANDGFEDVQGFIRWFFPTGKGEYWGRIIHWTTLKY